MGRKKWAKQSCLPAGSSRRTRADRARSRRSAARRSAARRIVARWWRAGSSAATNYSVHTSSESSIELQLRKKPAPPGSSRSRCSARCGRSSLAGRESGCSARSARRSSSAKRRTANDAASLSYARTADQLSNRSPLASDHVHLFFLTTSRGTPVINRLKIITIKSSRMIRLESLNLKHHRLE